MKSMDVLHNSRETLQTHHQSDLPSKIERKEQRGTYLEQISPPSNNPFLLFLNPIKEGGSS